MSAVVVVYSGLVLMFAGIVVLVRPLPAIRLPRRAHGLWLCIAGVCLALIGAALPAPEQRTAVLSTHLDQFMPRYQFSEYHVMQVAAPPESVFQAIQAVTADEIHFFNALTWIRRFGRRGPESILNAPGRLPLLGVATRTTFFELAKVPGEEVVVGTFVSAPGERPRIRTPDGFKAMSEPGHALAAMNFRVVSDGRAGSVLSTETRVFATDAATRRRFAVYWRVIYPGSAIIRRSWLAAIRRRAEKDAR